MIATGTTSGRHRAPTGSRRIDPHRAVEVHVAPGVTLTGELTMPATGRANGLVVLVHSPGSPQAPQPLAIGDRELTRKLSGAGLATIRLDLMTRLERECLYGMFDNRLLAHRLAAATAWLRERSPAGNVPVSYFATGAGSGIALAAAEESGASVCTVTSADRELAGGRQILRTSSPLLVIVDDGPAANAVAGDGGAVSSRVTRVATRWLAEQLGREASRAIPRPQPVHADFAARSR